MAEFDFSDFYLIFKVKFLSLVDAQLRLIDRLVQTLRINFFQLLNTLHLLCTKYAE